MRTFLLLRENRTAPAIRNNQMPLLKKTENHSVQTGSLLSDIFCEPLLGSQKITLCIQISHIATPRGRPCGTSSLGAFRISFGQSIERLRPFKKKGFQMDDSGPGGSLTRKALLSFFSNIRVDHFKTGKRITFSALTTLSIVRQKSALKLVLLQPMLHRCELARHSIEFVR